MSYLEQWDWQEIVDHARSYSPYYRDLYVSASIHRLADLPLVDQNKFWESDILTSDQPDGIVFKSGGSTGAPKFSYFTSREWQSFTTAFGWGIAQGILDDGDRVGNVFYVGDMYASFVFLNDSMAHIPVESKRITRYPIGGATDFKLVFKSILEFNINVLVGVPTSIMSLMDYYVQHREMLKDVRIEKVLFGGESMYPDQQDAIRDLFPGVRIASVGYASVDAGLLGFADRTCMDGEHRVFDGSHIIELIDSDTGEPIEEVGQPGRVIITNLTRKLMPIIRYPAGDMAVWVDPPGTPYRKFRLMGRSGEAARLGTINVHFDDTRMAILRALPEISGLQMQLELRHYQQKDELVIRLCGQGLERSQANIARVEKAFVEEKSMYIDMLRAERIHPLVVELVEVHGMEMNGRTGKMKRVIDRRQGG